MTSSAESAGLGGAALAMALRSLTNLARPVTLRVESTLATRGSSGAASFIRAARAFVHNFVVRVPSARYRSETISLSFCSEMVSRCS